MLRRLYGDTPARDFGPLGLKSVRQAMVDHRIIRKVRVRDPQTGAQLRLTVIGVLSESTPLEMNGISTSQKTLDTSFPGRAYPTIFYFALSPDADAAATATQLESTFLAYGMEAESIHEVMEDVTAGSMLISFAGLVLEARLRHEDVDNLTTALDTSRMIGTAVGILMSTHGLTDTDAFAVLRRTSMDLNRKLRDVASHVTYSGELPDSRSPR